MKAKIKSFRKSHAEIRTKSENNKRGFAKKSRKQRRKDAKKEKKERKIAYFSGKREKSILVNDLSKSKASNKEGSPKKSAQEKRPKMKKQTKEHLETEMKNIRNADTAVKSALKKQMKHPQTEAKKRKDAGTAVKSKSKEAQKDWGSSREDLELKRLEKLLKVNTKSKKSLPSSFVADGLDYILNAVDGETLYDSEESDLESSPKTRKRKALGPDLNESRLKKSKLVRFADEVCDSEADSDITCDETNEANEDMKRKSPADGDADELEEGLDEEEDIMEEKEDGSGSEAEEESKKQINKVLGYKNNKGAKKGKKQNLREDIYGRLVDESGRVISPSTTGATGGKYIPPAKRAAMMGVEGDAAQCERLQKQMKGLLNRASESNMKSIANGMEDLYMNNSRAVVNETLFALIIEACTSEAMIPERFVLEMVMLVAILHNNVGSEVGAFFLQKLVKKIEDLRTKDHYGEGHIMDNMMLLLCGLYNFKLTAHTLLFDVMKWLVESFSEKDVELILLLLKSSGFNLRRDDPEALGHMITSIQKKARECESQDEGQGDMPVRLRFMLEVLMAIRNNNVRKVPGVDLEAVDRMRRAAGACIRDGGLADNQLKIGLVDLLKADEAGRWWVVGSAWEGHRQAFADASAQDKSASAAPLFGGSVSQKLVDLARKLHMNSDVRRSIFFVLMTSEDFQDAFQKVLLLGIKGQQEREIVVVAVECCKAETQYNPYYSYFLARLAQHDRRFMMALQFYLWDVFKVMETLPRTARYNLARMLAHQVASQALPLSVLKVLEFGSLERRTMAFLRTMLAHLLTSAPTSDLETIFVRVGGQAKLRHLSDGLSLFLSHYMRTKTAEVDPRLQRKNIAVASAALTVTSHTVL